MNTFKKLSVLVGFVAAIGVVAGCSSSGMAATKALPHISEVTAPISLAIAADLNSQLESAQLAPRPARVMQTASVVVAEMCDVVVVEASRLPADERFADSDAQAARHVAL